MRITLKYHNKASVLELAKAKSLLEIELNNWGTMNTPVTIEDQVTSRANGEILRSKLSDANKAYEEAFSQWKADGFPE